MSAAFSKHHKTENVSAQGSSERFLTTSEQVGTRRKKIRLKKLLTYLLT